MVAPFERRITQKTIFYIVFYREPTEGVSEQEAKKFWRRKMPSEDSRRQKRKRVWMKHCFRSDYLTRFSNIYKFYLENNTQVFCQSLDSVMINNCEQFYSQFLWLFSCNTRDCQQLSLFPLLAGYPVASVLITLVLRTDSRGCRQSISTGVVSSLFTKMGVVASIEVCFAIKLFVSPNVRCVSIGVLTLGVMLLTSRSFVSAVLWRHFTDKVFCRPVTNVKKNMKCKIFSRFRLELKTFKWRAWNFSRK